MIDQVRRAPTHNRARAKLCARPCGRAKPMIGARPQHKTSETGLDGFLAGTVRNSPSDPICKDELGGLEVVGGGGAPSAASESSPASPSPAVEPSSLSSRLAAPCAAAPTFSSIVPVATLDSTKATTAIEKQRPRSHVLSCRRREARNLFLPNTCSPTTFWPAAVFTHVARRHPWRGACQRNCHLFTSSLPSVCTMSPL